MCLVSLSICEACTPACSAIARIALLGSCLCCCCRYPQLLQLLTAALPAATPSLAPLLSCQPDGFSGQLVRLSVHVEELLLPGGDDVLLERPKIANYTAAYRLPGQSLLCPVGSFVSLCTFQVACCFNCPQPQ
jgi:hypothetical protein